VFLGPTQQVFLDHVSVLVRDLKKTQRSLKSLGFDFQLWGRFPEGFENGGVVFPGGTYLEFLDPYDLKKANQDPDYARLKGREKADSFALKTRDPFQTLDYLQSKGFVAKFSQSNSFQALNQPTTTDWQFRDVYLDKNPLPGDPFWVQYNPTRPKRLGTGANALGVQKILAVWIVVKDLKDASIRYGRAGVPILTSGPDCIVLSPGPLQDHAPNAGLIVLVSASGADPDARSFARYGEDGVYRISLECEDLRWSAIQASALIRGLPKPVGTSIGKSILLPKELTPGVRIDLTQPPALFGFTPDIAH